MTVKHTNDLGETGAEISVPVSPYKAGFFCRCPKCGEGALYKSGLELVDECAACGFDLRAADTGDGAQVFVILILGAICAVLGFLLYNHIPKWLLAVILGAVILVGTVWMLRVFKATLVALQFHHNASEGTLVEDENIDD